MDKIEIEKMLYIAYDSMRKDIKQNGFKNVDRHKKELNDKIIQANKFLNPKKVVSIYQNIVKNY